MQESAYANDAKLTDLQHQIQYQTDYTNDEWLKLFENGGVSKYVDPKTFFDTSVFIELAGAGS